ncbi:MAG: hypothetical protein ACYDCK_08330 [Thermoplasmatota archaeon]
MENEIVSKIPANWRGEARTLSPPGVVLGAIAVVFAAVAVVMLAYTAGLLLLLATVLAIGAAVLCYFGLASMPRLLIGGGALALLAALVLAVRGLPFGFRAADVTALALVIGGFAAIIAGIEPWRSSGKSPQSPEPPKPAA